MDPESTATNGDAENSDDDVDSEIFNAGHEMDDGSGSRLKRSIRHIRSNKEAIKGSLRKAKETTKEKVFGRGKKREENTKSTVDAEVESGVEIVEDMVFPAAVSQATISGVNGDDDDEENNAGDNKLVSYFYTHI